MKNLNIFTKTLFTFCILTVSFILISFNVKETADEKKISELSIEIIKINKELQNLKAINKNETYSMDPFIGEVGLFAGNFAPRGWAFCEGQLLDLSENTALFSILGNTYGGNGRTTFRLPDLSENKPNGVNYIIALKGIFPSR
ncbi:Phage Tail Collar Domain [Polaribacter sp. KT25b]|nr:Phage Tail Collar Domain [Polaribacter sp. KT25b]